MKKKLILSITIIIIIINALLPYYSNKSWASNTVNPGQTQSVPGSIDQLNGQTARNEIKQNTEKDVNNHKLEIHKDKEDGTIVGFGTWSLPEAPNMASVAVKILIKMFCIIPYTVQYMMTVVTTPDNEDVIKGSSNKNASFIENIKSLHINWFTIQDAVFGKVPLFNVDFFDVTTDGSEMNSKLKTSVVAWYNLCFKLALVFSLLVLIYIGIRMALATNPEGKVNYKKMFKNWIVGFALLFILHYGIIVILELVNWTLTLIPESISGKNFEIEIITKTINIFDNNESAWYSLLYAITYVIIVGYQVYFIIKYFKRLLTMGFLVMIAPLITVTYAIDKAGDGKAQAFETWKKMFIGNAFMQSVHALMYMIFMYSASEIATKAPMIAVIFFIGILKGEEIFKKLFKLETD